VAGVWAIIVILFAKRSI